MDLPSSRSLSSRRASRLSRLSWRSISWLILFCSLASSDRQHAMATGATRGAAGPPGSSAAQRCTPHSRRYPRRRGSSRLSRARAKVSLNGTTRTSSSSSSSSSSRPLSSSSTSSDFILPRESSCLLSVRFRSYVNSGRPFFQYTVVNDAFLSSSPAVS